MAPTQGWFESNEAYRSRVEKEANEKTIERSSGSSPSQGFFESDGAYRDRISREANEARIQSASGSAPSQGFFESDAGYRARIEREANERTVERSAGSAPRQGFFEGRDAYEVRVRREANEHILRESGSSPRQGFFEGDHAYRSRVAHEAREKLAEGASAPRRGGSTTRTDTAGHEVRTGGRSAERSNGAVGTPSPSLWLWAMVVVALGAGWLWVQSSRELAAKRSQVAEAMEEATQAVRQGQLVFADSKFEQARAIAGQVDPALAAEVVSRRAGLYQRLDVPGNAWTGFKPVGKTFYSLESPLKCRRDPSSCGYHFVSSDSRRIYASGRGVSVRLPDGSELLVTAGLQMSDLVPVGTKICCTRTLEKAAPTLVLVNASPQPVSVFLAVY